MVDYNLLNNIHVFVMLDLEKRDMKLIIIILMAQVKLLFPSLTNAGGLFSFIAPHSALLSMALPEDQNT